MPDKYAGTACENCAGCYLMRDPGFMGKQKCQDIEKPQPGVWCADESVARFRRTGQVA